MQSALQLYLASQSPRRRELLSLVGVRFQELKFAIDETPAGHETAAVYVERMALEKAQAGWQHSDRIENLPVLGADTIVVLDQQILGKPADREHAIAMLSNLAGKTHHVLSAVAVVQGAHIERCLSSTEVSFAPLSPAVIEAYWQTGEPQDKSGSYGLQGFAATFIERLNGSPTGVMGLPLFETTHLLKQFGITIL